jgi:membrane-bound lytic murein transglycosylase B
MIVNRRPPSRGGHRADDDRSDGTKPSGRPRLRAVLVCGTLAALGVSAVGAQPDAFQEWLAAYRTEALASGISAATLDAALAGLEPLERVIERDRNQPEFTLDFRTYLTRVASDSRIEEGRRVLEEHRALLEDVGRRYGMPPELLTAVWGIESNFGRTQGDFSVVQALATLAYDGRRGAMFRRELTHALRILDQGHVELERMKGSWAGAMGQLQFMPSTFVDYAKDGDGDGRKNIWGSPADALESAATFMASQWRPGLRWGRQVSLPEGFDLALGGLETSKPLAQWQALGVRLPDGSDLPTANVAASLVLPDDVAEPAFLVYQNYRALMRWNRSHFFALAVGHLSDRIAGGPPLQGL